MCYMTVLCPHDVHEHVNPRPTRSMVAVPVPFSHPPPPHTPTYTPWTRTCYSTTQSQLTVVKYILHYNP